MKIFFYSSRFAPSIGGIETMAEILCTEFVRMGHTVVLATEVPGEGIYPFEVLRQPTGREFLRLLRWSDIHLQANVSLRTVWARILAPRKMLYRHGNVYQRDDGSRGFLDYVKTAVAFLSSGIANSTYTAAKTGSDCVILNAYNDEVFRSTIRWAERERDLVFLGRLVSQKGADTLLEALVILRQRGIHPALTIIGDGPEQSSLEELIKEGNIERQVVFAGRLQGAALAAELGRHRMIVVPSRIEEPFGIVALEGLACGCLPVVSERGGLRDAVGGFGFTFPNGDAMALASLLSDLIANNQAARSRLDGACHHLSRCKARAVAELYIEAFNRKLETL